MQKKFKKLSISALMFLLAFSSFGAQGFANSDSSQASLYVEADHSSSDHISIIVELDEDSVLQAKHKGKKQSEQILNKERKRILAELQQSSADIEVIQEYDTVFSGFSAEIPQSELYTLTQISGVKAVYPNAEYEVTPEDAATITDELFSAEMLDSAPFIGAKDAWEAGYTGEGVTVAILDTGVDYTHPDLAHAFGDYKGWDFVDNDNDPQETPAGDPRGASTNHGSHVAGTVAANGNIKGVAPNATLLGYRVLGPGGRGTTANVIAGIERAVQDGVDVMNLSLGASINDPDYATSIALDTAMADGVVAVTSNGNSGPNNWTVGSPGTSREAISVGATQLPYNVFSAKLFTSEGKTYPSAATMGFPSEDELLALNEGEYEFVNAGLGRPADFSSIDVRGKIALISRGDIAFVDKVANAKAAGAVGAVMYNNVAGNVPDVPGLALPTIRTTLADGQTLLAELAAGNNTISFDIAFSQKVGETMASFSSRGPVMDTWMIKPDVSAPGVAIVSTVPTHNAANPHGYASMQGTSMASPHVAGAAALILEAHPEWSVEFVKAALMNTAENLFDMNGKLYPHNSQGAGSIRVLDAINTKTLATPGSHSFGIFEKDNGKEVKKQKFTVHNLSEERKRYSISFTGQEGVKVQTSNNLQVQPGQTQDLNFSVHVDTSKLKPGYYEGTFLLNDGKQTIEVPTILFVQQPDYPLLSSIGLSVAGGYLTGDVYVPVGADQFELRIRNASTGALLTTTAQATNVPRGFHAFRWDMTIDGQPLKAGRYLINAYAKDGDKETELTGSVITIE
ncbi:minor extracellular serine protease Vpr [Planomicrobium soli]|uniref:Minor extracellular serine protease Vpr n=1 Tax=Planomicrobium soli TaxID=1176648 RepID=A0A2P8H4C6_9BACL|nr:S8 family serine peptidase [Planomicrobium soli]PSL41068.1 minor extracellular serine protease Vpr [Planomicrobium soli]